MGGVSIFVQTLNEETNLPACLDCVSWSDDIVVLDSFSTDGTETIARDYGARFVQHEFCGRAEHQNWAMQNIEFRNPWVYYTDADEHVTSELAAEIRQVVGAPMRPEAAFRLRRRDYFMGRWIKRSSNYPLWFTRLFRPDKISWARKANPICHVDGPVGELQNDFLHYPFSNGFDRWFLKHNKYSTYEAEELIKSLQNQDFSWKELGSRDRAVRRRALKKLSFRAPARPVLKFVYLYFWRLGLLDGGPGLHYCLLQAFYEYQTLLKSREITCENVP